MVILGTGDAARLPAVPGRMVYGRDSYKHFIQTPLIEEDDIKEAIAIAKGRELELIELNGHEPRIVPDRLLLHIINSTLQGKLAPRELATYFKPVGITAAMLKPFLEDVVKAGWIRLGEQVYQVCKLHRLYYLQLVQEGETEADTIDVDEGLPTTRQVPVLRRLGAPAPLLMLPAPAQPIEALPVPEPEPPALNDAEQVKIFADECFIESPRSWTLSQAVYAHYLVWCEQRGLIPLHKVQFGEALVSLGFKACKRGHGGKRGWDGFDLKSEVGNVGIGDEVGDAGEPPDTDAA
jgi:hypothetical protein